MRHRHGELAVDNLQFAVLKIQILTLPFGLICAQDIFQWSNGVCQQVVDRNKKSLLQHQEGNASCPLWLGEPPSTILPHPVENIS